MRYEKWRLDGKRFLAMTGYTVLQFGELLPYFKEAHDRHLSRYGMDGKLRKGRKFVLYSNAPLPSVEEWLVFILSFLKLNPIQEQHADLFGMEQRQCNSYIHVLSIILQESLALASVVPAQTPRELAVALETIAADAGGDKNILHDGTEREVPRPSGAEAQKEKYSGKKKKHTVKNAVITNAVCYVLFVSLTCSGNVHDKKIADTYTIAKGLALCQDCGYQGYKPDGVAVTQPMKKPKGGELTQGQKDENRRISSFRVRVEHAIGSIKRLRVIKDECRLRKNGFVEKVILTAAALHNFRINLNPFQYKTKFT